MCGPSEDRLENSMKAIFEVICLGVAAQRSLVVGEKSP